MQWHSILDIWQSSEYPTQLQEAIEKIPHQIWHEVTLQMLYSLDIGQNLQYLISQLARTSKVL